MQSGEKLFTNVHPEPQDTKITYHDPIFMAGSCFTEHIGNKLDRYKYDVLNNPFGILYNPVSLATSFERIARLAFYHPDELVLHDGLYHSMDHHGSYSAKNKENVIEKINRTVQAAHDHLRKSKIVFVSPGTSKVYRYSATARIVGNCHKIPQGAFSYEQLTLSQCEEAFENIHSAIRAVSAAKIVWTVSPVRHIRDGLIENQRSKSVLILGIEQVMRRHQEMLYFPAYEIMMDQLRDYRFYARDLIHPSPVAIDIIWDMFNAIYLDPKDSEYHGAIEKIKRAMEHRQLHEEPEAVKAFAQGQLKHVDAVADLLPHLNWQKERQHFFHMLELD